MLESSTVKKPFPTVDGVVSVTWALSMLTLAVLVVSSGCLATTRRQAWVARTDLVSLSRDALLACAGPPDSSESSGSREYLHYVGGPAKGEGKSSDKSVCVATFVLRYGSVDRVDYTTPGGRIATAPEHCLERLRPCLANER